MNDKIKNVLMTIHEDIREKEEALVESLLKLDKYSTSINIIEDNHKTKIINEMNSSGKPVYSNDTKRQLQLDFVLANDAKYKKRDEDLKALQKQIDIDKIEIKYLYNKQSNFKALTKLADSTPDEMMKS